MEEEASIDFNPLGLFLDYAVAVLSDESLKNSSDEGLRNEYAARLRLVTSTLAAASRRLEAIAELEHFCRKGVAFPMFGFELYFNKLTTPTEDLVTSREFTQMLPGYEIEVFD